MWFFVVCGQEFGLDSPKTSDDGATTWQESLHHHWLCSHFHQGIKRKEGEHEDCILENLWARWWRPSSPPPCSCWSPLPPPSSRQPWVWTWPPCWWWRQSSSVRWRACPPPQTPRWSTVGSFSANLKWFSSQEWSTRGMTKLRMKLMTSKNPRRTKKMRCWQVITRGGSTKETTLSSGPEDDKYLHLFSFFFSASNFLEYSIHPLSSSSSSSSSSCSVLLLLLLCHKNAASGASWLMLIISW